MTFALVVVATALAVIAGAVGWYLETHHGAQLDALARWLDME